MGADRESQIDEIRARSLWAQAWYSGFMTVGLPNSSQRYWAVGFVKPSVNSNIE